jgi:hypothetical protein
VPPIQAWGIPARAEIHHPHCGKLCNNGLMQIGRRFLLVLLAIALIIVALQVLRPDPGLELLCYVFAVPVLVVNAWIWLAPLMLENPQRIFSQDPPRQVRQAASRLILSDPTVESQDPATNAAAAELETARPSKFTSPPAFHAILAILPFLIYALITLWMDFTLFPREMPAWRQPFTIFTALVLIGFGAGVWAGFPRWTYSYLFWALIFAVWLHPGGALPYYSFQNYPWLSPLVCALPIFVLVLALLLARRSFAQFGAPFVGLWQDWTLFALGFYCFLSWLELTVLDRNNSYLAVFILAASLAASAGAWFYFHTSTPIRRVLGLIAGLIVMTGLGATNAAICTSTLTSAPALVIL